MESKSRNNESEEMTKIVVKLIKKHYNIKVEIFRAGNINYVSS